MTDQDLANTSAARAALSGRVAILIVGYQNADDIETCLRALQKSTDSRFVVLICENGGTAAYLTLTETLSRFVVRNPGETENVAPRVSSVWRGRLPGGQFVEVLCANDNLGYAGGVNVTIERLAAYPDWWAVWVLNPDTIPDENALAALSAKAASNPAYGVIGSRVMLQDTNRVHAYGGRWRILEGRGHSMGMRQSVDLIPDSDRIEDEMTYVLGASMYVTRAFIETVGVMDEDYFLYVEEVDWCYRRGSFKLGYADNSIVNHLHGTTLGSSKSRRLKPRLAVYLTERNKHRFTRKFYPHLYPVVVLTSLAMTALYAREAAWRNFAVALSGWWAGLRGEVGKPKWLG